LAIGAALLLLAAGTVVTPAEMANASTPGAITSVDAATATVGAPFSFTVTTTGANVRFIHKNGSLPGGLHFAYNNDGTATISGTPNSGGVFNVVFTAAFGMQYVKLVSQHFTLTVDRAPAFTSPTRLTKTVGHTFGFLIKTAAHPVPAITETGTLPNGVTFTDLGSGKATLAGTPATGSGGVYSLTITANNGIGTPATQDLLLVIDEPLAITSGNALTVTAGTPFSFTVTYLGYPIYDFIFKKPPPSGVHLLDNHDGTATLSGTVSTPGTYTLLLNLRGVTSCSCGPTAGVTQTFILTVNP